jgi:hypothetical protein
MGIHHALEITSLHDKKNLHHAQLHLRFFFHSFPSLFFLFEFIFLVTQYCVEQIAFRKGYHHMTMYVGVSHTKLLDFFFLLLLSFLRHREKSSIDDSDKKKNERMRERERKIEIDNEYIRTASNTVCFIRVVGYSFSPVVDHNYANMK